MDPGQPDDRHDGTRRTIENPNFGSATSLVLAVLTLITTLAIARFASGFWSRLAVLLGLVIGTLIATVMGKVTGARWAEGRPSSSPAVLLRWPAVRVGVIISPCIVVLVIMARPWQTCRPSRRSSARTSR